MTDHDELLRVASREVASVLVFSDPGTRSQIRNTSDLIAKNILDAIEPLIRADEHDHVVRVAAEMLDNLRAKVEALHDDAVRRGDTYDIHDVLALLGDN